MKIVLRALLITIVGVGVIDYFSHLLFSAPMETLSYFLAKASLYFVFSILFLWVMHLNRHEFWKVVIGGFVVASLWGTYYNILPAIFEDFYPFGIPLSGLTALGMGLIGTGVFFAVVHTLAFIGGYYATKPLFRA